ncbi:MAG: hypothetical protein ABJL67_21410 [Sulfitobacter sp.]
MKDIHEEPASQTGLSPDAEPAGKASNSRRSNSVFYSRIIIVPFVLGVVATIVLIQPMQGTETALATDEPQPETVIDEIERLVTTSMAQDAVTRNQPIELVSPVVSPVSPKLPTAPVVAPIASSIDLATPTVSALASQAVPVAPPIVPASLPFIPATAPVVLAPSAEAAQVSAAVAIPEVTSELRPIARPEEAYARAPEPEVTIAETSDAIQQEITDQSPIDVQMDLLIQAALAGEYTVEVTEDLGKRQLILHLTKLEIDRQFVEALLEKAEKSGEISFPDGSSIANGKVDLDTALFNLVQKILISDGTIGGVKAARLMTQRAFVASGK